MLFTRVVSALAVAATVAAVPAHIEARLTKKRLTQWQNGVCGEGQHHIYENKDFDLKCINIDGQTHSFDFALGGATHLIAFTETGCSGNSRVGVLYDIPAHAVNGNGDCVDADNFLKFEPSYANGARINSVKFE